MSLSDEINKFDCPKDDAIGVKAVKEFIKELKKEIPANMFDNINYQIGKIIDERAGDKLI